METNVDACTGSTCTKLPLSVDHQPSHLYNKIIDEVAEASSVGSRTFGGGAIPTPPSPLATGQAGTTENGVPSF